MDELIDTMIAAVFLGPVPGIPLHNPFAGDNGPTVEEQSTEARQRFAAALSRIIDERVAAALAQPIITVESPASPQDCTQGWQTLGLAALPPRDGEG